MKIAESLSDKTDTLRSLYKEQTDSRSIAEGPVLIGNMADIFSKGGLKLLSERYFHFQMGLERIHIFWQNDGILYHSTRGWIRSYR